MFFKSHKLRNEYDPNKKMSKMKLQNIFVVFSVNVHIRIYLIFWCWREMDIRAFIFLHFIRLALNSCPFQVRLIWLKHQNRRNNLIVYRPRFGSRPFPSWCRSSLTMERKTRPKPGLSSVRFRIESKYIHDQGGIKCRKRGRGFLDSEGFHR